MFRYGKYLIVPMECDYTTREDISTDILYTNRGTVALTNPARSPIMYVPGNINKRLTATRVNFNIQSVGFSNYVYNMFVYPNHFGNIISHFPAIGPDTDIIGDLLVKHKDYSRWISDRRFGVLLAPLINDNENRKDLRRGVNFSLLKSVENDPDVIWSFVSIYTRRDQSNRILIHTETGNWLNVPGSFVIGSNTVRFTYKYGVYVAELHAINKGICNYLAIRMYT